MKVIWKYPLDITDRQTIVVPKRSEFLSVVMQDEIPVAYFLVENKEQRSEDFCFLIRGTGHGIAPIELECFTYVGTLAQVGGRFMWHIFGQK